jgi:hypothetical protein
MGRWGRSRDNRVKGRVKHKFDPRNMKNRVNPTKSRRKLETNRYLTQDLSDAVWTNEPGSQLTGGHPERQVLGG